MLIFPQRSDLQRWVDLILEQSPDFVTYLPHIDDEWFNEMMSCVELTQLNPQCHNDLVCAGAKLFYKIIKNHHRVDGNKRSALLVTVLFFVLNKRYDHISPLMMYRLAEWVASDIRRQGETEERLRSFFSEHLQGSLS